ncbi:Methyltransferase domain-containing protein [Paraburkholderia phenazinium]|uniref:Methyltransferase domain-containing protein n=1 Tax=Paraburkholderia phenazinium TaxID=60549 RepID=A0A1G7ZJL5_9BURK|nr:class I SAM-dependent methyltransferase [Paraburkholderia phenazinium]SDH08981.1 Methyltransferase domain-containing protein [Paraburkholderia phenazinium]
MSTTAVIEESWPESDLEAVAACPYCGSSQRELAYADAQDWAFYCAPGKWAYWNCSECQSLYLDPRPTPQSIGRAYGNYYTHGVSGLRGLAQNFKSALRNECYKHWHGIRLSPRLHLPGFAAPLISPLKGKFFIPFGLLELAQIQPGKLLDIGCGSGDFLLQAKQMGWQTLGIDLDSKACEIAQSKGLRVINGGFEQVGNLDDKFDCLFCSHILEHTYDPIHLLNLMKSVLNPNGTILLSLPNSQSAFRHYFGKEWRGLEAPRHIAIPSAAGLKEKLEQLGFHVHAGLHHTIFCATESFKIRRRSEVLSEEDKQKAQQLSEQVPLDNYETADFIHFTCSLRADTPLA